MMPCDILDVNSINPVKLYNHMVTSYAMKLEEVTKVP